MMYTNLVFFVSSVLQSRNNARRAASQTDIAAPQKLEYEIRMQLTASTRVKYNNELTAYIQQIKSEANVILNASL